MNKDLQSIGDTHQNTQHAKALQSVLCKRKAMIHVSEEMKTKASDLDRLPEQIGEKKALGSTTFEEKIKIRTITTESWSIVKATSYFSVLEYLIRQARELKKFMVYFVKTVVSLFLQAQQRKSSSSMRMTHTHV